MSLDQWNLYLQDRLVSRHNKTGAAAFRYKEGADMYKKYSLLPTEPAGKKDRQRCHPVSPELRRHFL